MFRNLRMYRLHSDWPESEILLSNRLQAFAFQPCGTLTERSAGFDEPAPGYAMLARSVAGADLLQLREQSRVLPAAAVNEALEERLEEFQERMDRPPGRSEKRDLKEEVFASLLPRALLKSERIKLFYLHDEQILGVGVASEPQAERVLDTLRLALGSLNVTPLAFETSLSSLIATLYLGKGPSEFTVGRECRMVEPDGRGATVTWSDIEITDPSIRRHVKDGLKLDRLSLGFGEVMSFVLDEQAVIRKIKLLGDEMKDEMDEEDPLARLDAQFVVMTGTLRKLVLSLKKNLGGYA
ncbi:MAG: recombination-associated protein RdgC [Proteobacteria bacterium]|nr:recombination-associated protein RdgC [Pseudomonadota bacterium]